MLTPLLWLSDLSVSAVLTAKPYLLNSKNPAGLSAVLQCVYDKASFHITELSPPHSIFMGCMPQYYQYKYLDPTQTCPGCSIHSFVNCAVVLSETVDKG